MRTYSPSVLIPTKLPRRNYFLIFWNGIEWIKHCRVGPFHIMSILSSLRHSFPLFTTSRTIPINTALHCFVSHRLPCVVLTKLDAPQTNVAVVVVCIHWNTKKKKKENHDASRIRWKKNEDWTRKENYQSTITRSTIQGIQIESVTLKRLK